MSAQYWFQVMPSTQPSNSSYCVLNNATLGCLEFITNDLTLCLSNVWPAWCLASLCTEGLSWLNISGLFSCWTMAMGKQLPNPSVGWSSLNGSWSSSIFAMISSAIFLSVWNLSSFSFWYILVAARVRQRPNYFPIRITQQQLTLQHKIFKTSVRTNKLRGLVMFSMCITITLFFISSIYFPVK